MRKHFFASALFACVMIFSAWAAPAGNQLFENTTKYVDKDGEMFFYQDTAGAQNLLNRVIPQLVKCIAEKDPVYGSLIRTGSDSLIRMINIQAFRATARS